MKKTTESTLYSKHNLWKNQYYRVKRWYRKTQTISPHKLSVTEEDMDIYLAFFMNCFHLYDWIKNSGVMSKKELGKFFFEEKSHMSICHDICIGAKHSRIDNPIYDPDIIIMPDSTPINTLEHNNFIVGNTNFIFFGLSTENSRYISIRNVIDGCMSEIDEFVELNVGGI